MASASTPPTIGCSPMVETRAYSGSARITHSGYRGCERRAFSGKQLLSSLRGASGVLDRLCTDLRLHHAWRAGHDGHRGGTSRGRQPFPGDLPRRLCTLGSGAAEGAVAPEGARGAARRRKRRLRSQNPGPKPLERHPGDCAYWGAARTSVGDLRGRGAEIISVSMAALRSDAPTPWSITSRARRPSAWRTSGSLIQRSHS